jgi:hypothetical protein
MIHASIRKALLQKCRRARERMKEGGSKSTRSAVANPVQVATNRPGNGRCVRRRRRTQLLRGVWK